MLFKLCTTLLVALLAAPATLAQPNTPQPLVDVGPGVNVTSTNPVATGAEDPLAGVVNDEIANNTIPNGGFARPPVDLNTGNAALEVIIPAMVRYMYVAVSPSGGDAPLLLYIFTLATNAWYDASAPYHPTAVGLYSTFPRQELGPNNSRVNTAILYATARVLNQVLPGGAQSWAEMLRTGGLDPSFRSAGNGSPAAIGNAAGDGVLEGHRADGMNWHGYVGRTFNPQPFRDYTGYQPRNNPYAPRMSDAGRWKPDIQLNTRGIYKAQVYVTPQLALVEPYALQRPEAYVPAPPRNSNPFNRYGYRTQVNQVLQRSAALTDYNKIQAEFFDNKFLSLGNALVKAALNVNADVLQFIHIEFLSNMATIDAGIVTWQAKTRYDNVRPHSAVPEVYGRQPVRAYGGPNVGTVNIPADEWRPYAPSADHPEYPSASTCFCNAEANALRLFLGTNRLDFNVTFPPGVSRQEPGVTPSRPLTLSYATWDDFRLACGASRVDAGVHFIDATRAGVQQCQDIGEVAYQYMIRLISGNAEQRQPAQPNRRGGAAIGGASAPLAPREERRRLLCRLGLSFLRGC